MKTVVMYSRDGTIEEFFKSSTTITRQKCDEFAISRAGGGVSTPLEVQGVCSYTVIAGPKKSKVFQFREEDYGLDMDIMSLATRVHPEFVPSCEYHGTIGDSRPLRIYEMDLVPGTPQVMARIPADDMSRLRNGIKDIARFFIQSWNNDQRPSISDAAILLKECQSNFDLLAREIPSRFLPKVERVCKELPSLFSRLPLVLNHPDLNGMNVLMNPETGNITGIVDWGEASILPFGFALYGLENLLGWMDSKGWHYLDHHLELESLFWKMFREEATNFSDADMDLIRAARMAGLFYRYGIVFDVKGVVQSVRVDRDGTLGYLDVLCTADEWGPIL